jgi:two-component system, cell cycle response regulator DivK
MTLEMKEKQRILVIEDNEQNIYMITYLLEHAGFEVLQARNGREGIESAIEHHPDLIILDIQLPEMDGYEVAERLRNKPALGPVPIVAVTSYAMVGDKERVLEAGCTGYLEKPIDTSTFVDSIARHFEMGNER